MFEELEDYREKIREFALKEFTEDVAAEYDRKESYPDGLRKKSLSLGIVDMQNPAKVLIAIEELCRVDAGLGIALTTPYFGSEVIMLFGNDRQKEILNDVYRGKYILGLGVTEPSGGSDVAALKTTAKKQGNKYILNGSKMFITNGAIADYLVILARTSEDSNPHHGLSTFLLNTKSKGFSATKLEDKLGVRATNTAELQFNNIELSEDDLIGEEGKGFYYIMMFFNISRIYVAAQSIGIARGAFDKIKSYIKENNVKDEDSMFRLSDVGTRIEASRQMTYNAASYLFEFKPKPELTSMAKAYSSETAVYAAEEAMEILGNKSLYESIQRIFRNAKIMEIWEGTSEIEKLVIARYILKGE
ncbi:MAG: acyl-CoA dehydrogenase family protein [Ferroplasma sp.]|uniref:acyl-CoA dehydrogenase family protein n=1 Tax=Ferroplasma sp. TaxID=2591003 RepID=UPI002814C18A|nr:acyl-CoA dehydrogenase family protein [Ferroplasma sp.]WMT52063.1 MAG: acyl-CoA dehydrogenase family protein [Ferroplasma sp.]